LPPPANGVTIGAPDPGGPIRTEDKATLLAKKVLEKKAKDVAILDMREVASFTDVFVVCTAANRRQVQAIATSLRQFGKEIGEPSKDIEGYEAARWVLVDFGDVVVHVFDGAMRGFYDLDGLWSDAARLPVPEDGAPTEEADEDDDGPYFRV
jgi:ribosome-associated protein